MLKKPDNYSLETDKIGICASLKIGCPLPVSLRNIRHETAYSSEPREKLGKN